MTAARALLSVVIGASLAACARALPPPGGEEDRTPPAIVGTDPEPLALVPDFAGPVVFRFDERISERNLADIVLVSPSTGDVEIDRGRSELRISIEGGWRPGIIYRVVLLPGVRDLFNNERRVPAELVFSTGPAIPRTALAGLVVDRITGRPARDVYVRATQRTDSMVYTTAADSAAFFAFQHLPPGTYEVRAFVDRNSNREPDPTESASRPRQIVFANDQDTISMELAVVPADTTPPRVTRADARDTLQVVITVDDYLEPDAPLEFVQAALLALPDSTPVPGQVRLMTTDSFIAYRRSIGDTVPATPARAARPGIAGGRPAEPRDTVARPYREFVLLPPAPLAPGDSFLVRVDGLTNISGLTGGGGEADFRVPRPPARADTTAAPVDTTAVRRDTVAVPGGRRPPPRR